MSDSYQDPYRFLIEKIQSGVDREESREQLYRANRSRVLVFFTKKGFSREDSEDLTQEVFIRVFNAIDDFQGESSFGRWLFQIAAHVFANEVRRRHTSKRGAKEYSFEELWGDGSAGIKNMPSAGISNEKNALDFILQEEDREAVRRAINGMPPRMRSCCVMRFMNGMKYREIAVTMKISMGTVKAHIAQAKERIQQELGIDLGPEPAD
jgi:RNA polymerase sigma-70 factor, ECF subfamily